MKTRLFVLLVLLATLVLTACGQPPAEPAVEPEGGEASGGEPSGEVPTMRLAVQFGLGYAPLTIAQEKDFFGKYLPGVEIEWKQFGSGGAIREALIAGELDAGVMGIPPFIIGWDKGAPWKVASGVCVMPLGLQTYQDDIETLADFSDGDKIAYPSPGSIQHILLSMAAEKELGDATALDGFGVAMAHPDGAAALLSEKDITAHFTSPPYVFEELSSPNIHQVVDGTEAFGTEFTFLVAVATQDFYENNPQGYSAFVLGLADAIAFINENPTEAASILAPAFKLDEETTLKYLTWPGMNYTTTPYGLLGFAPFMKQAGYIEKIPERLSDLAWTNVLAAVGQASGEASPIEKLQERP